MANEKRPSLRDFDAYADRNGQDNGEDSPLDVARPAETQRRLASDPDWDAEVARLASGRPNLGATDANGGTDAVEAEVPRENIERISDPTLPTPAEAAFDDAVDRATASVGQDDEDRR